MRRTANEYKSVVFSIQQRNTNLLFFSIRKIPDLDLNKYQTLADSGVDGVLKRHQDFLEQWHGICRLCGIGMHLIFVFNKKRAKGEQLEIYLGFSGAGVYTHQVEPLLLASPLSDYYIFEKVPSLPDIYFSSGATLIKNECEGTPESPSLGGYRTVYYVPHWKMNQDARMYDTFRMLKTVAECNPNDQSCAFRMDLFPAALAQESRKALAPVIHDLRGDNDIILSNDSRDSGYKRNSYADAIMKDCEDWITALETGPHFRVNIYAFGKSEFDAKLILTAAAAEALEEGDYGTFPIGLEAGESAFSLTSRIGSPRSYCRFGGKMVFQEWSTTFTLEEAGAFFRLPALFEGETIDIPKESAASSGTGEVFLGQDMHGYDVYYPLKELAKHAFFCGTPGSGKTNTMLHLVTELHKLGIPFLVLEPAKKEYRALLNRTELQDIQLFSPHLQSMFPLRLNPFDFPKGVQLSEHISALLEVFQGAFVLEGPTYKFLSSSIQRAYEELGWDIEASNDGSLPFPTIGDVYNLLEAEIDKSSYDSEIKGNVRSFLQVRLGGLMERDAGELFDTEVSTLSPEQWLYTSAIVELEVLPEQTKNFFVLLLCHYICESLKVNPNADIDKKVRHAILIEEAHNIIAETTQQSSTESIDPKISATAYIVKMLAEVRARREAILIADQLPTALAAEVTKNTGLKLVHRLTAKDDRNTIGSAISASGLQQEQLITFRNGQALAFHEHTVKPFAMQVCKWAAYDEEYLGKADIDLHQALVRSSWYQNSIQHAAESLLSELKSLHKEACKKDNLIVQWEHASPKASEFYRNTLKNLPDLQEAELNVYARKCHRFEEKFGSQYTTEMYQLLQKLFEQARRQAELRKQLK